MRLYEVTDAYRTVLSMIEAQHDGEGTADPVDWAPYLDTIRDDLTVKAESVAKMVRQLGAEADAISAEAKMLAAKAAARDNSAKRLKDYLLGCLVSAGVEKVTGALLTISVQQSPATVSVVDAYQVPIEYLRAPTPLEDRVDKRVALAALKAGEQVPGLELVEGGKHVRIR